ncbi:IS1 family transposase [Escherichia coli]
MSGLNRAALAVYAYDSLRKTVVAHVFGERTMATLGRLMSLLSPLTW